MKTGKISENIYRRSILKNISQRDNESVLGDLITVAQTLVDKYNQLELTAIRTLYRCINRLLADGVTPIGVQIAITLTDRVSEKKLADTMRRLDDICASEDIIILGGHTEVSDEISRNVVSITAIGRLVYDKSEQIDLQSEPQVVLTKWIALGATSSLAMAHRQELEKRLPAWLLDDACCFDRFLSARAEAHIAWELGALDIKSIGAKGIFGSLWELGQSLNCGMEIMLRDIPIRQETVEVCELLDNNPYEEDSSGALLIVTKDAKVLVERLTAEGISAAMIGKLNSTNDRVLLSGGERRFLDKT